jgi:hypothetical protein
MAEFALMIPVLILLLFGMTFAAFYAFRSAAVDWGVFVTGVATGSYNTPATGQARESVLWPDLADRIQRISKRSAPGAFADLSGRFARLGLRHPPGGSAAGLHHLPPVALLSGSAASGRLRMKIRQSERGQALAETALFAVLAILMAFGLLAWIPAHRARTAATAAAYACSQFLSQSPDPARAAGNARKVAWSTLNADWSASLGVVTACRFPRPAALVYPDAAKCPSMLLRCSMVSWD